MPLQFCSERNMEGKSKVVRNLFGTPNHEELRKDLDNQLKELNSMTSLRMKSTWNFDSDLDAGLDGRYEWRLVQDDEYVPACYRKTYRPTKFRSFKKRVERSQTGLETPPCSPICIPSAVQVLERLQSSGESTQDKIAEDIENMRKENETTPEARIVPVKQTRIGDYMKVKKPKRRLEDDLEAEERSAKLPKLTTH